MTGDGVTLWWMWAVGGFLWVVWLAAQTGE